MSAQQWDPGILIEVSGSYWKSCVLYAGVKLDVFTAIGEGELTADEIARRIEGDPRGLTVLLNALCAMELLKKRSDRFRNTDTSAAFLSKDSPRYIGHMIVLHHHLSGSWYQLDRSAKTGTPVRIRPSQSDEEYRESFIQGTATLAMHLAPQVVNKLDMTGRRRLLDLGGGTGVYAIHFCMKNPELKAVVYDLLPTSSYAKGTIARFGMGNRIQFIEGNYLEEDIPGRYDAAFLSQVIHSEGPDDCRTIIKKTAAALEPGGLLMIHDLILNDSLDGPLFPALFSLNMLLLTPEGRTYSGKQVTDMLFEEGLRDINVIPMENNIESSIITGIVP